MAFAGAQYTITATATNLTTILGLSAGMDCRQIDIKNATLATAPLFLGKSNVTNTPANAFAQIAPGQAWSDIAPANGKLSTNEVYLVGTANAANIAFIAVVT